MSPISGQVDKKTQRVAWKIGSNHTVLETSLQNLTQDVASCLVHFGADVTQTWLLVRPNNRKCQAPLKTRRRRLRIHRRGEALPIVVKSGCKYTNLHLASWRESDSPALAHGKTSMRVTLLAEDESCSQV